MPSDLERLMSKVVKDGDCWILGTSRDHNGYSIFYRTRSQAERVSRLGHRAAYELIVGPIPEGLTLDHLCRNRPCVNPEHLEPVTQLENWRRGSSFSAVNARLEACVNGHPYDSENTYYRPNGHRDCRACIRARAKAYSARKRAA